MQNVNCLAIKGLVGWHIEGRSGPGITFSSGPYDSPPGDCPAIDMSGVYERDGVGESAIKIWRRPNLNLDIPDNNVRNLFEGCIGHEGTTDGHPWNGKLESLQSSDAVGLTVYIAILIAAGGTLLPTDYEACGQCGFDHSYEYDQASKIPHA